MLYFLGVPIHQQHRPGNLESSHQNTGSSRHTHNNRQALHEAQATSFGTFIVTDSQFGNPIVGVIPRLDPSPVNKPS